MPLGTEVGLVPGHNVLDEDLAPPPRGIPQFSAHVSCGQTAGWTKMPLGTEVGLVPRDTVFDGVWGISSPLYIPHFSAHVYCGQMAGWIKMSFGTEVGFGQATLC